MNERQAYLAGVIMGVMGKVRGMLEAMESEEVMVEEMMSLRDLFLELDVRVDSGALREKIFKDFCLGK